GADVVQGAARSAGQVASFACPRPAPTLDWPVQHTPRRSVMGLLDGKKGLILNVANDRSIAWHIGHNAIQHGANCGFGYLVMGDADKSLRRAKKSLDEIGAPGGANGLFLHECDVASDASIAKFFAAAKDR